MEKYKYSSLTDEQHNKIMEKIGSIKTEDDDIEARYHSDYIYNFIWSLEDVGFICPKERARYNDFIETVWIERKEERKCRFI